MNKFEGQGLPSTENIRKPEPVPDIPKPESLKQAKDAIKKPLTRETIVSDFNIPPELFEQPQSRVIMDAAIEILTESNNLYSQEDLAFAQEFLKAFASHGEKDENEVKDERKNLEKFEKAVNLGLSVKMREAISADNPSSLLAKQREILGIIHKDKEKPFDIKVLDIPGADKFGKSDNDKKWREFTGAPTLFVNKPDKGEKDQLPTIFLSSDVAKILLEDPEILENTLSPNLRKLQMEDRRDNQLKMLQHEYRHTQRDFSAGEKRFFYLMDEVLDNITGYNSEKALMGLLTWTNRELTMDNLQEAYNSGDQDKLAEALKKIKDLFGPLGLLKLGDQGSTIQSDVLSGKKIMDKKTDPETNAKFLEKMLQTRGMTDNNYDEIFKEQIKSVSRRTLEVYLNHWWQPYTRVEKTEKFPNISKLVDIVKAEILVRKINGERGFYDAEGEESPSLARSREAIKKDEEYRKTLTPGDIKRILK